jgi:hypothetical protein
MYPIVDLLIEYRLLPVHIGLFILLPFGFKVCRPGQKSEVVELDI